MKYKNVEIMELCPLVFVCQGDCKNGEILDETITEEDIVDDWLKEIGLKNVYAECNIDNMVKIRQLAGTLKCKEIIDLFRLCKKHFIKVELGVFLKQYIQDDTNYINFVEIESEEDFWREFTEK